MKEILTKVEKKDGILVVNSRVIAEQLGKDVQDVKKKIREVLEIGTEYFPVEIVVRGKIAEDLMLTKDGFILLTMNYTGYNDFKRAYINEFNRMENELTKFKIPKTYKEAVQDLLLQIEENEKLQLENSKQKEVIEIQKPKADYFDALVDTNLLTSFRDTAKELKVKESLFIQFLIDKKYIFRDKRGKLKPMAQYVDDLFELKEFNNGKYSDTQTRITPKGREVFRLLSDKFLK